MYKSISIRDARHSLELNTSMWRLSWITFIFLPLTFLAGFFGMNVDAFANAPSLKWYFRSILLPLLVLIRLYLYFLLTRYFANRYFISAAPLVRPLNTTLQGFKD